VNVAQLIDTWRAAANNFLPPGGPVASVTYGTFPELATADLAYPLVHIETEPATTFTDTGIAYRGAFWVLDKEADTDPAFTKGARLQAQARAQEIARGIISHLGTLEESQDRPWFLRPISNRILFISDDLPDRLTGVRVEWSVEALHFDACELPLGYGASALEIPFELFGGGRGNSDDFLCDFNGADGGNAFTNFP
jgi:hypothetical protein